jgi:O-antigen/teichoic acid export membrane protein
VSIPRKREQIVVRSKRPRPRDLRSIAALTGTEGLSRALSFAYYVAAARILAPAGFGTVRYTITLALLAFGLLQVLVTVLGRELGAARGDERATGAVIGTALGVGVLLWAVSALACVLAVAGGLTRSASGLGLFAVLCGYALFQIYYAIAWGLGDIPRMAIVYAGGGLVQLGALLGLGVLVHPSPAETLVLFGVSNVVPIACLELTRPILRRSLAFDAAVGRRLVRLGLPLLAAQLCYVVWASADQVWVQQRLGAHAGGLYGAAKSLIQVFLVVPAGVNGVVMPRVAQLRAGGADAEARRLIARATGSVFAVSAVAALAFAGLGRPVLSLVYGGPYGAAADALAILCAAMALYAAFGCLTFTLVGWGSPGIYSSAIAAAAVGEVAALWLFPASLAGAATANAAAIGLGLAVALVRFAALDRGAAARSRGAGIAAASVTPVLEGEQLPTVTVVIPTYGGRAALASSLPPLLADPAVSEIVVVVDGFDDGSVGDLQRLGAVHPKLRWELVENGGEMAARAHGVEVATGEIVLLVDQDVVLHPGTAAGHARRHAARPGLVVVGYMPTSAARRSAAWSTTHLYARDYERHCESYERDPERVLTHLWGGNVSLRRTDCLAVGLERSEFRQPERYHSDREFGLRCLAYGLTGVFDRRLRADHLHSRDLQAFVRDSRSQGTSLARLHQLHAAELGPLDPDALVSDLPAPVRRLVTACRAPAVERLVGGALLAANRLSALVRLRPVELATAKILRRIGQQHGIRAAGGVAVAGVR